MCDTTAKDNFISARIQRRKPVIGEKSSGGKMGTVEANGEYVFTPIGGVACKTYTRPSASTRHIVKARKHCGIPGVYFIYNGPVDCESSIRFQEPVVFYHHKKDETPHFKTLKNKGKFYCGDLKNDVRRKSNKGTMKFRININDY